MHLLYANGAVFEGLSHETSKVLWFSALLTRDPDIQKSNSLEGWSAYEHMMGMLRALGFEHIDILSLLAFQMLCLVFELNGQSAML